VHTPSLVLVIFCVSSTAAFASPPPTVFAPDVISGPAHESAPAFTPDGGAVYFTRGNVAASTILVSQRRGDTWGKPTIAAFSGEWSDMEAAMAPDGSFLVFVSNRPSRAGGTALDGHWNGKTHVAGGGNLWRVDRRGNGWSTPVRLPDTINRSSSIFAPSVVRDGSIYFMDADAAGNHFHLYRSQLTDGVYGVPAAVAFGDPSGSDVDPAVAPDESYAVFGSSRSGGADMDLYFVRKLPDGSWGTPRNMTEINSPGSDAEARLSPDGKTLYFSSERVVPVSFPRTRAETERALARQSWDNSLYNIWQVDLTMYLEQR
jgi:Tol biopolymer transport system component